MTGASKRLPAATAIGVAVAYMGLALLDGGYATTTVAWLTIAVWAAVAIGIVVRVWPRAELPGTAVLAIASLAGLAALSVVSMLWADDAGRAFSAALLPAAYAGLLALVVLASPATGARSWLLGVAVGSTAVATIAVASRLDPGLVGAGRGVASFLPGAEGRLSYPIGYWNGLSSCAAVSFVLLTWLGAQARERAGRAVAVGFLPIPGLAIFLTSSRGGVAAAALGVVILVALGPARTRVLVGAALGTAASVAVALLARGRYDLIHNLGTSTERHQGLEIALVTVAVALAAGGIRWWLDGRLAEIAVPRRIRRAGVVAMLLAAVAALAIANPLGRLQQFSSTGGAAAPGDRSLISASGSGRAQFWEAAVDAFGSRPVLGVGAGNYELYWNAHPEAALVTGNAHSLFLEGLAGLGLLGLAFSLGPFVAALVGVRDRLRRGPVETAVALALLAAASVGAAIDWTWKIPVAFAPVVIGVGLLTGTTTLPRGPVAVPDRPPRRPGGKFGLGVAALVFAWGAAWVSVVVLIASARLGSSHDAAARGDLEAAASDARSAASVEPFSPEPPLQLALVEEAGGNLGAARAEAQQAIDKAGDDWRTWAVAARIDRQLGAGARAAAEQARAQSLSPVPLPASFLPKSQ